MILEITDYFGTPVKLQPRVELYSVRDFMGREMPGLAIVLDEVMGEPDEMEPYATLTVSFGEFIGLKNSAYTPNIIWQSMACPRPTMAMPPGMGKRSSTNTADQNVDQR